MQRHTLSPAVHTPADAAGLPCAALCHPAGRTEPTLLPKRVYADLASIWLSRDVFVLDFAGLKGAPQRAEHDGTSVLQHHIRGSRGS